MSIILTTTVSSTVTEDEWKPVYEEVKKIGAKFNLGYKKEIEVDGIETICIVPSEEVEEKNDWNGELRTNYIIDGDLTSYKTAERFYISNRITFKENAIEDPIEEEITDESIPYKCASNTLFAGKTQGKPYHLYLLAIATFLEHRLKNRVYVDGDIDREDCEKALGLLKEVTNEEIKILSNCDIERFCERIMRTSTSPMKKLEFLYDKCLAENNEAYKGILQKNFDKEIIDEFFKRRFKINKYEMIYYLCFKFDLEKLCHLVLEMREEDNSFCVKTIKVIGENADFVCSELGYSEDSIKQILKNAFGEYCDTDQIFEEAKNTREQNSSSFVFQEIEKDVAEYEKYDIRSYADISYYKKGCKVHPRLEMDIGKSLEMLNSFTKNEEYSELMEKNCYTRCIWLSKTNRYILLRKEHWEKIYTDIQENYASFKRYYSIFVAKAINENVQDFLRTLIINDDFYTYAIELMNRYSEN